MKSSTDIIKYNLETQIKEKRQRADTIYYSDRIEYQNQTVVTKAINVDGNHMVLEIDSPFGSYQEIDNYAYYKNT